MTTDKEVMHFMGGADGDIEKQTKKFEKLLDVYEQPPTSETKLFWAIHQGQKLVGHVQLKPTDYTNKNELELVYMVHPDSRRKGLMTEVLNLIKQEQYRWKQQIIATIEFDNEISMRLLNNWGIIKKETQIDPEDGEHYWKVWLSN